MLKTNTTALRSRWLHSAHTVRSQRCWRLHSAHHGDLLFLTLWERCKNAIPQRLYSFLNTYQRTVGSPRKTPKIIKFAIFIVYTTSSQCPHIVPTAPTRRLYSVDDAYTARTQLLERVRGALIVRIQRFHDYHSVPDFLLTVHVLNKLFWRTKCFLLFQAICYSI